MDAEFHEGIGLDYGGFGISLIHIGDGFTEGGINFVDDDDIGAEKVSLPSHR